MLSVCAPGLLPLCSALNERFDGDTTSSTLEEGVDGPTGPPLELFLAVIPVQDTRMKGTVVNRKNETHCGPILLPSNFFLYAALSRRCCSTNLSLLPARDSPRRLGSPSITSQKSSGQQIHPCFALFSMGANEGACTQLYVRPETGQACPCLISANLKILRSGSGAWTRTMITSFKGWCPAD